MKKGRQTSPNSGEERGGFSGKERDLKRGFSDEIYNALVTLIKDASLRKTLGENAKQFVEENYSLERMVGSYKKVYEDTIYNSSAAFTG